jgi:phytoene synthase
MPSDPFAFCEDLIRRVDFDRYLSALFAPERARRHLFALYAFNYEVAKTAESVTQPVAGQIRLQWWRDAIAEICAGNARAHEVASALAAVVNEHRLPQILFDALIDARENDLAESPFTTIAEWEAYADATSGHLMRLAARILGGGDSWDDVARHAGIALSFTGLLRAVPFHAARERVMLPAELLESARVSERDLLSGRMSENISALIARVTQITRNHLDAAKTPRVPRALLPALLPAALVPLYLSAMTRSGFDPFCDSTEAPVHRRQLAMLKAMIRGRL